MIKINNHDICDISGLSKDAMRYMLAPQEPQYDWIMPIISNSEIIDYSLENDDNIKISFKVKDPKMIKNLKNILYIKNFKKEKIEVKTEVKHEIKTES